jgi:hypothetical protein
VIPVLVKFGSTFNAVRVPRDFDAFVGTADLATDDSDSTVSAKKITCSLFQLRLML